MSSFRATFSAPLAALLATLMLVEGCYSWRGMPPSPDSLARTRPAAVRLLHRNGTRETLRSPQFTTDSIVGKGEPGRPARVAVAFSDVQLIEVERSNALKSGAAAVGVAFGALSVVGMIVLASWNGPFGH